MNKFFIGFEDIIRIRAMLIASFACLAGKLLSNTLIISAHHNNYIDFIRLNEIHINRILVILLLCLIIDTFKALTEKRAIVFSFSTYLAFAACALLSNIYYRVDDIRSVIFEMNIAIIILSILVMLSPILIVTGFKNSLKSSIIKQTNEEINDN